MQEVLRELHMRLQLFLSSLTFTMKGSRKAGYRELTKTTAITKFLLVCNTLSNSLVLHSACLPAASHRR